MPPRTIIYIHHEKALGGAPISLLYLLQQLDRRKYSPHILCLREGPAAELFRKHGFSVQIVPGPDLSHTTLVWFRWWHFPKLLGRLLRSIPLLFRLRRAISRIAENSPSPVLVHLNSSTLLTGALATKSLGIPVVWHIREPLARGYFGIRRQLLRWAICGLADRIIAISHHDAAQIGSTPKLSVIYNFIDFARFDASIPSGIFRKECGISTNAFLILYLGGSANVKGANVLVEAIPQILKTLPSAHLIIAGETSSPFKLRLREPPLSEFSRRLHLIGSREDIPAILADASLLLFPSTVPHFARPVIEAAAMGKPVIASDLAGIQELVIRNETGLLVPPGDPETLAQSVIGLAQDQPRAYRLGQQGLSLAREKFDAAHNAVATFAIYEQVLDRHLASS